MSKITFLVTKGETTYDMSELVESATWSGRKGSPARTLSVSLIDDDGWKHARSGIDVTKGNHCVFYCRETALHPPNKKHSGFPW